MTRLVIERHVTSETLTIPELKDLIGRDVRITISVRPGESAKRFEALRAAVGKDLLDTEAIKTLRDLCFPVSGFSHPRRNSPWRARWRIKGALDEYQRAIAVLETTFLNL